MRGFGGNTQFRTPALEAGAAVPAESSQDLGPSVMLLGFYSLSLMVPIAELIVIYLHVWVPVVWIADAILTVLLLTTGRMGAFLRANVARPWMIMLVLFSAAAVLGLYPGRSVPFIFSYGLRFHIYPIYACALALNTRQVRHAIAWIGSGSFIILALCIVFGEVRDGRLIVPDTDFSNPNDLGLGILLAMGALVVFRSKIARTFAFVCVPLFVMEILRTGSRACLVTLIALLLMLFMLVSSRTKILLGILVPIAAVVIAATMSSFTLSRLTLIVADTSSARTVDDQELSNAIGSQAARTELQKRALELTFSHPLLGVGATNLEDGIDEMIRGITGKKSGWQGAHNTYLEVAGENGFPAAILYIVAIVMTIRLNYRSYRICRNVPQLLPASTQCLALLVMAMAFAVCTSFSNNAYSPPLCAIVGLSAANFFAVTREAKAYARAEEAVQPFAQPRPKPKPVRYPAPVFARPQWPA
jgi:hypothetical protein